jgi:hypothetical protein
MREQNLLSQIVEAAATVWCFSTKTCTSTCRLLLWKIVSKETTFGGGEHHTNGTRVDKEDGVPANALARGLRRTEHRR